MRTLSEKGDARSQADAAIVKTGEVIEAGRAFGAFNAQCIGPAEKDRAHYKDKRQELFTILGHELVLGINLLARPGPGILKEPLGGFWSANQAAKFVLQELLAIPFEEKWTDGFPNVITTVGANDILDKYFAGSAYTSTPVIGLKAVGAAVIADTQASHASWLEQGLANAPVYTGNRPAPTWSVAAAKSKAFAAAVNFAFTSGGTVAGCFINNGGSATKDLTTGILVSAGDFTGGTKLVANTDQINVSWSISV